MWRSSPCKQFRLLRYLNERHITGIATKRNNPQRMFGSVVVLDGNGSRDETDRFQRLLQRVSQSRRPEGRNSDRNAGIQGCESPIISLAATLSRPVPNADGGMNTIRHPQAKVRPVGVRNVTDVTVVAARTERVGDDSL